MLSTIRALAGAAMAAVVLAAPAHAQTPFNPQLSATIGTAAAPATVGSHPQVRTLVTQAAGEAAISRAQVTLPAGLEANLAALSTLCSTSQLASRTCPPGSRIGTASATTPFLPVELSGSLYFVENPGGLPNLAVLFLSPLEIQLNAAISIAPGNRLVTTFEGLPNIAITRFELVVAGGPSGAFTVAPPLCQGATVDASYVSHLGQTSSYSVPAEVIGCQAGGAPGAGAEDTTAPSLFLAAGRSQRVVRQRGVTLTAGCDEDCTLVVSGSVSVPGASRTFAFAKVTRSLAADRRVKLRLRLSRSGLAAVRRAVASGRRLTARVAITATDKAGNRTRASRRIALKR